LEQAEVVKYQCVVQQSKLFSFKLFIRVAPWIERKIFWGNEEINSMSDKEAKRWT